MTPCPVPLPSPPSDVDRYTWAVDGTPRDDAPDCYRRLTSTRSPGSRREPPADCLTIGAYAAAELAEGDERVTPEWLAWARRHAPPG